MWTAQSSESSHFQLQNIAYASARSIESETALCIEPRSPDVTEAEALYWKMGGTDCGSGMSPRPSWFEVHNENEATLMDLVAYNSCYFDEPITNGVPCLHQQHDALNSFTGLLTESLQQQIPGNYSCENQRRLSSERCHHQHQQHPHQHASLAEDKAASQTANLADKWSSGVATQKCGRAALTVEELRLFSGSAPCSLTYKGRRLRYIAPKPTPETVAETATLKVIQPTQHHQSLPVTTFSVVISRPRRSPATTATTSTSTNSTTAPKQPSSDDQPSSAGKTLVQIQIIQ